MMTVDDCLRAAWRALLRGDTAERDRYCDLAKNVMAVQDRLGSGYPTVEAVVPGAPICLPDLSKQEICRYDTIGAFSACVDGVRA